MKQHQIDEYQDTYCQAWELQNEIDARINKMVFTPGQRLTKPFQDQNLAKRNGSLGGRPKKGNKEKLSVNANVINNMLKYDLTAASIAGMLELQERSVKAIIKRYGLPRDE